MKTWSLRLGIVVVLAVFWSVFAWTERDRAETEVAQGSWKRENYYVNYANYQRFGSGPLLAPQTDAAVHPSSAFRVLAIGDSYSYGYGSPDGDARWPTQLELELTRRLGPGKVRVDVLLKPGSATVDQAAWLREYQEPYDAVVLGYTWNDIFPGKAVRASVDATACPARAGAADDPGVLNPDTKVTFACTVERLQGGTVDELPAAYSGDPARRLEEALTDIVASAAGRPVLALQLLTSRQEFEMQRVSDIFARAGVVEIDPTAVYDLLGAAATGPDRDRLMVDPTDPHPSMVLTRRYAEAFADALEEMVPATVQGGPVTRPLVSNFLPHTMSRTADADQETLTLDAAALETVDYFENDRRLSSQFVPCMGVDAPHARVMFDPFFTGRVQVRVTSAQQLVLWTTGYDDDGDRVNVEVGPIVSGREQFVQVGGPVAGILLASPVRGCPLERDVLLGDLTVELVRGQAAG